MQLQDGSGKGYWVKVELTEEEKPKPPKSKFISEFKEKETKPKKSSKFSKKLVEEK